MISLVLFNKDFKSLPGVIPPHIEWEVVIKKIPNLECATLSLRSNREAIPFDQIVAHKVLHIYDLPLPPYSYRIKNHLYYYS